MVESHTTGQAPLGEEAQLRDGELVKLEDIRYEHCILIVCGCVEREERDTSFGMRCILRAQPGEISWPANHQHARGRSKARANHEPGIAHRNTANYPGKVESTVLVKKGGEEPDITPDTAGLGFKEGG